MTKHVAIYARFSSDLQNPRGADDQVRLCRERAAREGWLVTAAFTDEGVSGSRKDRPGLNALMERAGSFDLVLTEAIDRLSRDQEDIAGIYKRLRYARCDIVTLADGLVTEVTIGFKGTMSAIFLKDLGDKTRRGQRGVVEDGRIPGGNSYGYRRVLRFDERGNQVRGLREIDEHQAAVIRRIFGDYAAGISPIAIARALNSEGEPSPAGGIWRVSTINGSRQRANGILNNLLYAGRIAYNRQRFEVEPEQRKRRSRPNDAAEWVLKDVPALRIVPADLWAAAAARRAALGDRPFNRQQRPKRLLSGLIRCGQCGGSVSVVGQESWAARRPRTAASAPTGDRS